MEDKQAKTSRVLSVYHLFLNCEEVSYQEFALSFGVGHRTAPDRTRQRDFKELEKLGYEAWYMQEFEDEPGRWYYEIPDAYGLKTIPRMKPIGF